ncbi:DDE Tnp4 domain-containing protein [Plasmodiophora brassicae]
MFGSLDCTHFKWDKCPVAWQGQYLDKDGQFSVIMEAIATMDLWIWHAYVGLPGANNDINVVDRSPLVNDLLQGVGPHCDFRANGREHSMAYFLVDGIYPRWKCFLQSIQQPQGLKRKLYAAWHEAIRKDVERAFGVLKGRFAMLSNPCRLFDVDTIITMVLACVILHNMIIEDERDADEYELDDIFDGEFKFVRPDIEDRLKFAMTFESLLQGSMEIRDAAAYFALREDIIEHLWNVHGESA